MELVRLLPLLYTNPAELDRFKKNPSDYLTELTSELTLKLKEHAKDNPQSQLKIHRTMIRVQAIPYTPLLYRKIDTILSDDIGNWVVVVGTVVQSLQPKTIEKSKVFACDECQAQYRLETVHQNYYRFEPPHNCTNLVEKEGKANLFTMFYKNLNKRKQQAPREENNSEEVGKKKLGKCGCSKMTPM